MDIIRYGNDINVSWSVYGRNGAKYSLNNKIQHLWLVSGPRKKEITAYTLQTRNQIVFLVDDLEINRLGTFKFVLEIKEPESEVEEATYELSHVFQVVSETYPMKANKVINGQTNIEIKSILNNVYISSLEGASAYEVAVENGFEGTVQEWLASQLGIKSLSQTVSSSASGGLNRWTATLLDDSTVNLDVYNGAAGAAGASSLSQMSDVQLSSLASGNVLRYNGTKWVNGDPTDYSYGDGISISAGRVISANISEIAAGLIAAGYDLSGNGGGGSGSSTLAGLTDVTIGVPTDGQVLTYESSSGKWKPKTPSSSGGGGGGGGGDTPTPSDLSNYVTLTGDPQTIASAKTFSSPVTLTGTYKRIYFGDTDHYLELNTNGYYFYGGGVYTDSFVSGGGLSSGGSGGGGATTLGGLSDVTITSASAGDALKYVYDSLAQTGGWVNGKLGISDLDVDLTGLANGYTLVYDTSGTTPKWKAAAVSSGGGGGSSYTLPEATATVLGGVMVNLVSMNSLSTLMSTAESSGGASGEYRNYPVNLSSDCKLYVNVPWYASSGGSSGGVTSVVGQTGDVTATQIATALSSYFDDYLPLTGGTMTGTINSQDIIPKTNNTYDLGDSSHYVAEAYVKKVYLGSGVYLSYDSTNSCVKVTGAGIATDSFVTAGGTSNSSNITLSGLSDIYGSPSNGQVLVYNSSSHKWVPTTLS